MPSLKTKFSVGLFVMTGLTLIIAAIIWLGMSHYFSGGKIYVAFFDESVQGLDKDSAVKYRGVSIGRVQDIRVAADLKLIEVQMMIEKGPRLENDMVAQLKSVGITGIMFIELDRKNDLDDDRAPVIDFFPDYPVIPTKPSDIKKFTTGVMEVLEQFKTFDLSAVSSRLNTTLTLIEKTVTDARIKDISTDIRTSLKRLNAVLTAENWHRTLASIEQATTSFDTFSKDADKTANRLTETVYLANRILSDNEKAFGQAISKLTSLMEQANVVLRESGTVISGTGTHLTELKLEMSRTLVNLDKNLNTVLKNGDAFISKTDTRFSELQQQLTQTFQNLEVSIDKLNRFLELISDQPSQLFFGQPMPPRIIETDDRR